MQRQTDRQTDETCICTNVHTTKLISEKEGGINGLISKINREQHFDV